MRKPADILVTILFVLYPLGIFLGLKILEPKFLGILLLALLAAKFLFFRNRGAGLQGKHWFIILTGLALCGLAAVFANREIFLKFYPFLVSLGLFLIFSYSLVFPPSVVERIARLRNPDLPPEAVAYTRKVTAVWCLFFVINGSIALWTALFASLAAWSLYNGLIGYILMGLLFTGEFVVRQVFVKKGGG